jgi:hypothetical protein
MTRLHSRNGYVWPKTISRVSRDNAVMVQELAGM